MEIQDLLGYTLKINVIIVGRAILSGEDRVIGYAVPRFLECRFPGYRSRGLGFDSWRYKIF
jgi:hypothetical protein